MLTHVCQDYLQAVMDVLKLIGKKYPPVFASVFQVVRVADLTVDRCGGSQDLLDIMIGWMVDPNVPSYVCDNLAGNQYH